MSDNVLRKSQRHVRTRFSCRFRALRRQVAVSRPTLLVELPLGSWRNGNLPRADFAQRTERCYNVEQFCREPPQGGYYRLPQITSFGATVELFVIITRSVCFRTEVLGSMSQLSAKGVPILDGHKHMSMNWG